MAYVMNPKTNRPYVCMTEEQAKRGAALHGGTLTKSSFGSSWFLSLA
jgi:hypothetical protein